MLALSILPLSLPALSQTPPPAQPPPPQPVASAPPPADLGPLRTSITVTGREEAEAPAAISTFDQREISDTPGINIDDRLRQVPGFTLFRRTSSVVANPTTQGVSLRGIGSSGGSRTLVLWDGIPMNDPFGGWVYWTRFAPDELERVEISRGASTSVFGDRAMSGAIALFSHEPAGTLRAAYEAGNEGTQEFSVGGGNLWRRFAVSGQVRAFTTDGYFIVPQSIRGAADTRAGVDFVAGNIRFDLLGAEHRLFVKLDVLAEDRANGTVLQRNSTSLGTLSANYSWQHENNGVSVIAYHTREDFRASFSAVAASRKTERLTYTQVVPSEATGSAAYWTHNGSHYNLLAGADVERAEGYDTDRLVPSGIRFGGGARLEHGTFAQVNAGSATARVFAGARYTFTGGDERFFSPSAGFVMGRGRLRLRGSGYRSFRAPTLNELYRDFRVGNTSTLANAALRSESLTGGEVGLDFSTESTRFTATLFDNYLDRLITNVTLSSTANSITRQRRNAASAQARGFESTVRRNWRAWQGEASYLYVNSRYDTGPRVAQVPRHQGSAQVSYARRGTLASAAVRTYSNQFDDDVNQFLLPGFASVQLMARQQLTRGLSAHLAIENLLDRQYYTGFTPTPTIGAPRLWRAGLRWEGRLW